jgi:hypothetical protein
MGMASLERNVLVNHNKPLNQRGEGDMVEREGWRWNKEIDKEGVVMCCCEKDGKKYRITDGSIKEKGESIIFLNESDHKNQFEDAGITADVLLFEWENYYFDIVKNDKPEDETAEVSVGDVKLTRHSGLKKYPLQFQNQLGKVVIRVKMGERDIELPEIEVISRKLWDSPIDELFYPTFYKNLVDSLKEHCLSLSFDILAPTYLRAEEALRPPSPLFIFHYFKRNWKEIMEAYNTIVYQPYKRLVERDNFVRISQVKAIDGSVIHDIISHPERWEKVKTQSPFPLAEKLKNRLPTMVLQREKYETYDVPENRFAKFFLQTLLNGLDDIMRAYEDQLKKNEFKEVKENFGTLRDFLMSIQTMDVFVEAGEMRIFPANSTVLQKRDGYRELLKLYREFLLSYCPLFKKIEEALAARDIATLYEYWCFFEIGKVLGEVINKGKPQQLNLEFSIEPDIRGGLREKTSIKFRNGEFELIYNKMFEASKKGSYSVPMRPDFYLEIEEQKGNEEKIVFDAKFRFDEKDVEEKLNGDEGIDGEIEKARKEGNHQLVAKLDDIFKMHTYKDALHLSSAFIVFPGTKKRLFEDKKEENEAEKAEKSKRFRGIGYIPLVPGRDNTDLKDVLNMLFRKEKNETN